MYELCSSQCNRHEYVINKAKDQIMLHTKKVSHAIISEKTGRYALNLLAAIAVMAPTLVLAGDTPPWQNAAQAVLNIFTGGLSKTLATIAVIALGIMAAAGKLEWGTAIKVIVGLVLIFGAANIVGWITAAVA